jgi:hypothetical protein
VITLNIFRGFPWRRVTLYILIQVLDAFTGALFAFAFHHDNIIYLDGALLPEPTGMAMYTQLRPWVQPSTAFFTELLGSAVHNHGARRQRQLAPRRRHARSHHRSRRNSDKYGSRVADTRLLQSRARLWTATGCAGGWVSDV